MKMRSYAMLIGFLCLSLQAFGDQQPEEIFVEKIVEEVAPAEEVTVTEVIEEVLPEEITVTETIEEIAPAANANDRAIEEIVVTEVIEEVAPEEITVTEVVEEITPEEVIVDEIIEEVVTTETITATETIEEIPADSERFFGKDEIDPSKDIVGEVLIITSPHWRDFNLLNKDLLDYNQKLGCIGLVAKFNKKFNKTFAKEQKKAARKERQEGHFERASRVEHLQKGQIIATIHESNAGLPVEKQTEQLANKINTIGRSGRSIVVITHGEGLPMLLEAIKVGLISNDAVIKKTLYFSAKKYDIDFISESDLNRNIIQSIDHRYVFQDSSSTDSPSHDISGLIESRHIMHEHHAAWHSIWTEVKPYIGMVLKSALKIATAASIAAL